MQRLGCIRAAGLGNATIREPMTNASDTFSRAMCGSEPIDLILMVETGCLSVPSP